MKHLGLLEKKCPKCGVTRPIEDWSVGKKRIAGWCRPCMRETLRVIAKKKRDDLKENPATPSEQKFCSRCKVVLSGNKFGLSRTSPDGLRPYCRPCTSAYYKEWSISNPEKAAKSNKDSKARNKEKNDPKRRLAYYAKYAENPEPFKSQARKQRARRKGAEGVFTQEDFAKILFRQQFCCAGCGIHGPVPYHADHIIPLSRGGSNWPENIQMLCEPCNLSKGVMPNDEFMARFKR